ncbi:MAG: acyltransferase [Coriobacteriia bacterium]|nr:acyltransferase [Coriobacteriia bacterium]
MTLRPGVRIEVTSVLRELGEGIEIGDRVGVSEDCFLGAKGRIVIGNDSMLGPSTKLIAENHSFERTDIPIREQGETRKGIVIGADCWLGANVVILDGVCVGDHSIVAAGAVVTEDVESLTVVGGVPARTLRRRS